MPNVDLHVATSVASYSMRPTILGSSVVVFCAILLGPVRTSSKFKSCLDASFCRRFRSWKDRADRPLLEVVHADSPIEDLYTGAVTAGFKVRSLQETAPNYGIQLIFPRDIPYIRFQVDDISNSSGRRRFRIPEGDIASEQRIPHGTIKSRLTSDYGEALSVFSLPGKYRVEVVHKNFAIKVLNEKGEPVIVINSKNFFAFEKFRTHTGDICLDGTTDDMSCNTHADTSGLWTETFAGFVDSKPRGPSAVGLDVEFIEADSVFGLPEHTLPFNLPVFSESSSSAAEATPDYEEIRFFNGDIFNHPAHSKAALYGSIPMITALHKSGASASGLVWLNPSETYVALTRRNEVAKNIETTWVSETGIIDLLILTGPTPSAVLEQYHAFSGKSPLPPVFAIGFHQSKWGYESQEDVEQVSSNFETHKVPLDVLWMDIQHTEGNRYFTWNAHYSDPLGLANSVGSLGRKLVAIVDPHIKVDSSYSVYSSAKGIDAFVKNGDTNTDFQGECWPGTSSYMDFFRSDVREFWAGLFNYSTYNGSSRNLYIWNDMNEPSVFNGPEMSMPRTALHGNGSVEHREIHNIYGQLFHRSTFEGLIARDGPENRRRPFVLSRSFFVGSHRYGPIWTGDNQASWEFLKLSVSMLLSLAVSGQSFSGADVGGFEGDPSKELFIRWHQLGAMAYPFYRCHSTLKSKRREPWSFDAETLDIVRANIETRYALLPYWYTAFALHSLDNKPIIRPLWFDFMSDTNTFRDYTATEEEMLVGESILVRPVLTEGSSSVNVYLPGEGEVWYDFAEPEMDAVNGMQRMQVEVDLQRIPVYIRGGSIIPMKLQKRSSTEMMKNDPISLRIFLKNSQATGLLYLDDEDSMKYLDSGDYALVRINYKEGVVTCEKISGNRDIHEIRIDRIEIYGEQRAEKLRVSPELRFTSKPVFYSGMCRAAKE